MERGLIPTKRRGEWCDLLAFIWVLGVLLEYFLTRGMSYLRALRDLARLLAP
jgi:hypothetical protein